MRPNVFARGLVTKEPSLLLPRYGLVSWQICGKVRQCQTWVFHERGLNEVQTYFVVFLFWVCLLRLCTCGWHRRRVLVMGKVSQLVLHLSACCLCLLFLCPLVNVWCVMLWPLVPGAVTDGGGLGDGRLENKVPNGLGCHCLIIGDSYWSIERQKEIGRNTKELCWETSLNSLYFFSSCKTNLVKWTGKKTHSGYV